jgi:hypothetical protein
MDSLGDVSVLIPAEYFEAFSKVISAGLQRAKITHEERAELVAWWEAEQAMMSDEIKAKANSIP